MNVIDYKTYQSMSLKISLTGSALFKSSAFSFPYCKKSIIASLITFLFRNTSSSSQAIGKAIFSTTLSGHIDHMKWSTVALMETNFKKMLWYGKNSSAGEDFPSEVRQTSRPAANSYHTRSVPCCVSFSEHKHIPKVYDVDEI